MLDVVAFKLSGEDTLLTDVVPTRAPSQTRYGIAIIVERNGTLSGYLAPNCQPPTHDGR